MNDSASSAPDSNSLPPFLEIVDVASAGELRDLPEITRLGRGRKNDVQVKDGRISKMHAEIHRIGHRYSLRDLRAKAGLFVNGTRIEDHVLQDGDVITFGNFDLPRVVFRQPRRKAAKTAPEPTNDSPSTPPVDPPPSEDLRSLARFLEFSRMYTGTVAIDEILDRVVDMAMEITAAERGFLILSGANESLEFEVVRGRGVGDLPKDGHRVSETIVRETLERRTPRVVSDISFDQELAQAQSIVSLELGSAAAIPLWRMEQAATEQAEAVSTREVFGVLYLDSRKRRDAFSKLDLGLLENLAHDASSVIENARLLREAEDKRRMEREIQTAREVQAALLPESYWTEPYFTVTGTCVPCLDLGGDYIDQFKLPSAATGYVVADVCGKGIAAALLAAALQGCLATEMAGERPLKDTVERVNRVICKLAPMGNFISMICCALTADGELCYVNAGHCPLLLVTSSGIQQLVTQGVALGIEESLPYNEGRVQMQPGDLAVMYTDGVIEADGPGGELYGDDRLEAVLAHAHGSSAPEVARQILDSVESFRGEHPVTDDITLMVVRYEGPNTAS